MINNYHRLYLLRSIIVSGCLELYVGRDCGRGFLGCLACLLVLGGVWALG